MKAVLLSFVLAATSVVDIEKLKSDLDEMERDALALEIYLLDKQDHKDYFPHIEWSQPSLDTYKETLKSHLPEGCK